MPTPPTGSSPPRPETEVRHAGLPRGLVVLALLIALAGLVMFLAAPPAPRTPAPAHNGPPVVTAGGVDLTDPESCKPCHAAIYAEWQRSFHAQATTDPAYNNPSLKAVGMLQRREINCDGCHQPRDLLLTVAAEQDVMAVPGRTTRAGTGVDCITCHVRGTVVIGVRANPRAPCRPLAEPALAKSEFCGACHKAQQPRTLHEWEEWRDNPLPRAERQECNACHMREAVGPPGSDQRLSGSRATHRAHVFPGGHDPAFIRGAVKLSGRVDPEAHTVTAIVDNLGTGHRFPTGYQIRRAWITIVIENADGSFNARYAPRLFKPPRSGGPGRQVFDRRRLELSFEFDPEPGGGRAMFEFWYALAPPQTLPEIAFPVKLQAFTIRFP